MFAQLRAALDTAREVGEPLTARQVLAMATRGGAAALGLADRVGVLAVGRAADLVVIQDLPSPTAGASSDDLVEELVAYGSPDAVSHVYCAGQPLRQDGRNVLADRATSARGRLMAAADADAPARRHRQQEAGELVESVLGCLRQAGIPLSGQGSQVGYAP
jgi:cytosine/adenosine deaminase-related metal-dependent hydrolase